MPRNAFELAVWAMAAMPAAVMVWAVSARGPMGTGASVCALLACGCAIVASVMGVREDRRLDREIEELERKRRRLR